MGVAILLDLALLSSALLGAPLQAIPPSGMEARATEGRTAEAKATEGRTTEGRAIEGRAKATEGRARVHEINFGWRRAGGQAGGRPILSEELALWGRRRNLLLAPDSPQRGLQDFEAELIAPSGLHFRLDAFEDARNYLYLDLVSFSDKDRQLKRLYWLEVLVNGYRLGRYWQGGGIALDSLDSPAAILIEREHIVKGELEIVLRPSPDNGFFAIWDAFVARYPLPTSHEEATLQFLPENPPAKEYQNRR